MFVLKLSEMSRHAAHGPLHLYINTIFRINPPPLLHFHTFYDTPSSSLVSLFQPPPRNYTTGSGRSLHSSHQ